MDGSHGIVRSSGRRPGREKTGARDRPRHRLLPDPRVGSGAGVFADVPSGPVRRGRVTDADSQLRLLRSLAASAPGDGGHDTVVMLTHPVLAAPEERARRSGSWTVWARCGSSPWTAPARRPPTPPRPAGARCSSSTSAPS
ncbi:hypothetical protein O1L60_37515 [Streptomyces diastatochromogenes]|nr:hypothetical protein [Streptomyces diastatochromogenes]